MKQKTTGIAVAMALSLTLPTMALFGQERTVQKGTEGAPIAQNMEIQVYRGVAFTGELRAVDNEGETVSFSLLREPEKGTVTLTEDGMGFVYTPSEHKSGQDSFTYVAQDTAGNVSLPATVKIVIARQKPAVTYRDMSGHVAETAAVRLAEEGVFTGAQLGGAYFFEPERFVSRSEFLAMAMAATGRSVPTGVSMTGFCDDASIPVWAKGYASTALQEGVITGVQTAEGVAFDADTPITLYEAAAVLNRLLSVTDVAVEELYASTPTWAVQAVANLESIQVLSVGAFGETGEEAITRGEMAQMLDATMTLLEERSQR